MEIWKDIKGYEGIYEISNKGRVKSLEREVGNGKTFKKLIKERILTNSLGIRGYYTVKLSNNGKSKISTVHRLIARAFLEDWNESLQVDHINGIKTDNSIRNLRMVSHMQNNQGFRTKRKGCTSKYRGVSKHNTCDRWTARIKVEDKHKHLGLFIEEKDAATAYNDAAIKFGYALEALNEII
jgi:hypothetical protein